MASRLTILPLVPFGNVVWYALWLRNNSIIDPNENFLKQTYRSRFEIATSQGERFLSISVESQNGVKTPVDKIKLFEVEYWKSQHLKTLESVYNSSPFYFYYQDELKELYAKNHNSLLDFSLDSIAMIIDCLELEQKVEIADSYVANSDHSDDYRSVFKPSKLKKKTNSIVFPKYIQVYSAQIGFIPNLSILDVLFNLGPESIDYIEGIDV